MEMLSGVFAKDVPAIFGEDRHKLYVGYQITQSAGRGDGPYPQFRLDVLCGWLKCLFPESAQTVEYRNYFYHQAKPYVFIEGKPKPCNPHWYIHSPGGVWRRRRPKDVEDFLREQYLKPVGCRKVSQLERLIEDAIKHSQESQMLHQMLITPESLTDNYWWQLKPEYSAWVMEVAEFVHASLARKGSNEQVFANFSTKNLAGVLYSVLRERIEASQSYRTVPETVNTIAVDMSGSVFNVSKKRMFVETVEGSFRREALEQVGQYCYKEHIAGVDNIRFDHRNHPIKGTSFRWAVKRYEPASGKWL